MPDKLQCSDVVFRQVRRSRDINKVTGAVATSLFIRTRAKEPSGLSVEHHCTAQQSHDKLNNCYGIASLKVGMIRDLAGGRRLDVVADSDTHANITGVPCQEDDPAEAEHFADLLKDLSRRVL
jgi:hypothetical protein